MTKKDYERAARILASHVGGFSKKERETTIALFAEFFSEENPRFDAIRFGEAVAMLERKASALSRARAELLGR